MPDKDDMAAATKQPPPAPKPPAPTMSSKQWKVTVETVPDEDDMPAAAKQTPPTPKPPAPATNNEHADNADTVQPGSLSWTRARTPVIGHDCVARTRLRCHRGLYIEDFPNPLAGAPILDNYAPPRDLKAHMEASRSLADPENFKVAVLLMTSGMTDLAKDQHLTSSKYKGKTPWCNSGTMLADINKLAHGPLFMMDQVPITDGHCPRTQYMVWRDLIAILREIFANPSFKKGFKSAPSKAYTLANKKERIYGDPWYLDWWWKEQENLQKCGIRNRTIVPLIITMDQTNLSIMCGGQKAYPVYIAPANILKSWRRKPSKRAMTLLGYLPMDGFEDIENNDKRRTLTAELIHRLMERMLAPLPEASENWVDMWCPDGRLRCVYPKVAAYCADFPEQSVQSCTSEGSCPICKTQFHGRSNLKQVLGLCKREETLGALRAYFKTKFVAELQPLNLKPVWPWWGDLEDVNLPTCFTPDLLHQVYQGIFKSHLVRWMRYLVGNKKLNERLMAMPMAEGLHHFTRGVTGISQWTGRESKQMMAQLLPVVAGTLGPDMTDRV
ncbi:hypothetical protein FRC07_001349 [Ceratobasidium sp. 392]|nr:hypothetical protein FRC07_001349 [Ceratobasidium sp. 392]